MSSNISYKIRESYRAKHLRLTVYRDGQVVVTKPQGVSLAMVQKLVEGKWQWIKKKVDLFRNKKKNIKPNVKFSQQHYLRHKEKARAIITRKVEYYSQKYSFHYNKIFIKNQKTRWGSCSSRRNLNFNYRLIFLTEELQNYVVVHELCHLKELNHSPKFWNLVAEILPNYKESQKKLKERECYL